MTAFGVERPSLSTCRAEKLYGGMRSVNIVAVGRPTRDAVALTQDLRSQGHEVISVSNGTEALSRRFDADLMLLELDLPDMDGVTLCRAVRRTNDLPIITFAPQGDELSRILGLEAGADDCLTLPYRSSEIMARIESLMRRVNPSALGRTPIVTAGPLRIETASREVWVKDRRVDLTRMEFDLLLHLAQRPGSVISRQRLMVDIWKHPRSLPVSTMSTRTIDTHVSSLRSKLGAKEWITAIRGVGFRLGQVTAERS
ncbi:response regulator transcription factor [Kineosporia sp. J2-2]|uniref:Response regulator transcription factor n=1 Tax=Kineosporia corallincola TaxID=2835133 RepID=A0ABS5TRM1_9ACTN|nr:response regulator transcription factor [Kineosporia corallincola]MBT0773443.1 response regulator transcription factor [Kineosporia corallincola]